MSLIFSIKYFSVIWDEFDSEAVTPEMFTETWLDNDWARWLMAKSMALDLSAFSVILLAQNQACSDSKQDSRAEMCDYSIRRQGSVE